MASLSNSGTNMVSSCVTSTVEKGFINIDSELVNGVTVTGIHSQFDVELSQEESAKLLNGFTVTGFSVDSRLGKRDPNMADLSVVIEGQPFRDMIETALNTATNGNSEIIDQYLANQLRNAFKAAFSNILPVSDVSGEGTGYNANGGEDQVEVLGADGTDGAPAADAGTAGSVAVTLKTQINGFSVDVLTDVSQASWNLVDQHSGSDAPADIFRQIPRSAWQEYLTDASGWAVTYLNTDALPMLMGHTLSFVFDMNVDTAGSDSPAPAPEDVPLSGNQAPTYGRSKFSLNLANRRVAFNIKLTNTPANAPLPFPVGVADDELRPQPTMSQPGENPGPGTNNADGANDGSTQ